MALWRTLFNVGAALPADPGPFRAASKRSDVMISTRKVHVFIVYAAMKTVK